jgi:uncharacterized protein (DUF3084 family)
MFIEVVRQHLESLPPGQAGWLAGPRDPFVGKALSLMHAKAAHDWTIEELATQVGQSRSLSASQVRAVRSSAAVTSRLPSGLNAALRTMSVWPLSTSSSRPLSASQMRAVLSSEAVTTRRPSPLKSALPSGRCLQQPTRVSSRPPMAAAGL